MKKLFLWLVIVAIITVFSLIGCKGAVEEEAVEEEVAEEEVAEEEVAEEEEEVDLQAPKTVSFLTIWDEATAGSLIIKTLTDEYIADHPNFALELEIAVQASEIDPKISTYSAADSLPELFVNQNNQVLKGLAEAGQVVNIDEEFANGLDLSVSPAIRAGIMNIVGTDALYALPTENNIEGIWYNKQIFADNNLEVPTTVDEMLAVAETLKGLGIQPFAASGEQRWPLTRLIANIAMRILGTDCIVQANSGELSFTDPAFVEAATIVQEMGVNGYFGEGVNTITYDVANDAFLNGQAAMYYMGTWAIRDFNDETKNTLGPDGIGFFSFPAVEGGAGSTGDYIVSFGLLYVFGQSKFDAQVADWAKYVFPKYSDLALSELGSIPCFELTSEPENLQPYTQLVIDEMAKIENTGLWMEYGLAQSVSDVATQNVQLLVLGDITPEEYCAQLDAALQASLSE